MTVAQLVASSGRTGVETHLLALVRALGRAGVRAILCCPEEGPLTEALRADGFEVRLAAPRGRLSPLGLARLARALDDLPLVHAHGPRGIFWSALLRAARPGRPALATVHELELTGASHAVGRIVYRPIERWSLARHDLLVPVSNDLAQRLERRAGIPRSRIEVVPNSSPLLLAPRAPLASLPAEPRAIVLARLEPVKGIDLLIEAWALLNERGRAFPLSVYGEGASRGALEALARARGVAHLVTFEGFEREPARALGRATLYVAPSRMEGLPGAVVEAMALGVPVVATRVGGNIDVLERAAPSWLVEPENARALADAVDRMRSCAPAEVSALRMRLADEAYARFHPDVVAARVIALYQRLGMPARTAA